MTLNRVFVKRLHLFVWDDAFHDYSAGIAFALAHDSDEARRLIVEQAGYTHEDLAAEPKVFDAIGDPVGFFVPGGS